MNNVQWIKIVTSIFDDEKVLLIESMPESDSIIVIWFKLLCLAGKQNNSGVFMLNEKIPYTDEMFSTIFRRQLNTVRFAIKTFSDLGMIEIINNVVTIPNWGKHQTLDKLEAKTTYMKNYMIEYRKKQACKTNSKTNGKTKRKANVSSADKDIYKEDSKELDKKELDKKESNIVISQIVDYLNQKLKTKYKSNSKATMEDIQARINQGFTYDDFVTVIDKKYVEWHKDEKMAKFLRPETLFSNKFEGYLNQVVAKTKQEIDDEEFYRIAKELEEEKANGYR